MLDTIRDICHLITRFAEGQLANYSITKNDAIEVKQTCMYNCRVVELIVKLTKGTSFL